MKSFAMRVMMVRLLPTLVSLAGVFFFVVGGASENLPGRIIEAKRLPGPFRRFVLRHFPSPNRFGCRWDKPSYYAVDESDGCLLLSSDGMFGFRYHGRRISREFGLLFPDAPTTASCMPVSKAVLCARNDRCVPLPPWNAISAV